MYKLGFNRNAYESINWEHMQYLHVYYLPIDSPYLNGVKLFIYQIPNRFKRNNSKDIVINKYNSDTADALLKFIDNTRKMKNFIDDDNLLYYDIDYFQREYAIHLQMLRSIFSDDHAFYYLSRDKHFLFYDENTHTEEYTVSLMCKFAATIGEFRFSVFAYHSDETKLHLSFLKVNNHVSQMIIFNYDQEPGFIVI
jgi:hypothetical protein